MIDGICPDTDRRLLADTLRQLVSVANPQDIATTVWMSLAILENHLEAYATALEYVDISIARSPHHAQAHLMRLYFGHFFR